MSNRFSVSRRRIAVATMVTLLLLAGSCKQNHKTSTSMSSAPSAAVARAFPALSFSSPVAMLQAPGDGTRWFVVERGGSVIVVPNNDAAAPAQTSRFIGITVNAAGEGGLLGLAFHPNFPATPQVFLSYTRTGPDAQHPLTSVVSRFLSHDGGATLDPASEEQILLLDQPFTNHKGGNIAFDRFGKLFIGFGDGGNADDMPFGNGQNVNVLLGKILRIDVDTPPPVGKTYTIPSDNPFASGGGAPEIYAWGFRNPWRWSFDRDTGRLWVGGVGQGKWEEVDIVELGRNYGWNVCEGAHRRGSNNACAMPGFVDPIAEYSHSKGCSITGGYVYRGMAIPDLFGVYIYGDFCSGTIWSLREGAGASVIGVVANSGLSVASFAQGSDGEVYVINLNGTLHKIVAGP